MYIKRVRIKVLKNHLLAMTESDLKKAVDEYQTCVKIREVWMYLKAVCEFDAMVQKENSQTKLFHLEFSMVSPLYHRLQEHLMAWGAKGHHRLLPTFEAPHRDEKTS